MSISSPADLSQVLQRLEALTLEIARLHQRIDALTSTVAALKPPAAPVTDDAAPVSAPTPARRARLVPKNSSDAPMRIAIMGASAQGSKHVDGFLAIEGCEIAYICDVDPAVAEAAAVLVEQTQGFKPQVVGDLREALLDDSVDVLSVAAPNHWHALATVWALKAGKHVFLETPLSHTFDEGEKIIEMAKRHGRVVHCPMPSRLNGSLRAAADFITAGRLGEVRLAHCITYKRRPAMGQPAAQQPLAAPALNLWHGPAAVSEHRRERFHYDWHWFWRYGNGALGNNGVHRMDAARVGLGLAGFGDAVVSYGGRFGPGDGGETPNVQVCLHKFGDTHVFHDICGLPKKAYKGVRNGVIFYGSQGLITYQSGVASLCDAEGNVISTFNGQQGNSYLAFIEAVLSNEATKADHEVLYQAHVSTGLCHLGNLSQRLAQPLADEQVLEKVDRLLAPPIARDVIKRVRSNLKANECSDKLNAGPVLELDARSGGIQNHGDAAAMMRSAYRPGFRIEDFL